MSKTWGRVTTAAVFLGVGIFFLSTGSALAQGTSARGGTIAPDGCNVRAGSTADKIRQIETLATNNRAASSTWYCQCVSTSEQRAKCVTGGCPGGDNELCCVPNTSQPPPTGGTCAATGGSGATAGAALGSISLPACVTSREAATAGKCTLTDIINVGIAFANFLLGLSGALLLGIFVYAGTRYIVFSYNPSEVSKAKDMIRNAVVGMLIIILAGTLVRFAKSALVTGNTAGTTPTAGTAGTTPTAPATGSTATCQCVCRNASGTQTRSSRSQVLTGGCNANSCQNNCENYCETEGGRQTPRAEWFGMGTCQ